MTAKRLRMIGWALSILIAIFLIGPSGMGKFLEWEGKEKMLEHLGIRSEVLFKIGIVEVALALLFLVPRFGFVAAILLTGYLGGAVMTHVRIGEQFLMPIVIGIFVWVALGLRQPAIFDLALGRSSGPTSAPN